MGIGSIVFKQGLKYARTGLSYASKTAKVLAHESVGDGYSVIQKARKTVGGKTIFQNFGKKSSVGWEALKQDVKQTANKPGFYAKAKSAWKIGVSKANLANATKLTKLQKLTAGTKGVASAVGNSIKTAWKSGANAAATSKYLGKLGKTGKILGGLKSTVCKAPFIYALTTAIVEGPKIYDAFKNGGFWAGVKETGKVCAGIAVGGALGALGTAVGGPVVGIIAFAAGEQITRSLLGDSDTTAAETKQGEQDELAEAQANGVMPMDPETQELNETDSEKINDTENNEEVKANENEESAKAETTQSTSELPEKLEATNTTVQGQLVSNPFTSNGYNSYSNPFGFDAGTNIFQRFPMGYTFQYQGNGMGMMI